jgi:hypothetical protein
VTLALARDATNARTPDSKWWGSWRVPDCFHHRRRACPVMGTKGRGWKAALPPREIAARSRTSPVVPLQIPRFRCFPNPEPVVKKRQITL